MNLRFVVLLALFLQGCAIAPVGTDLTGRTYGSGSFYASGGYSTNLLPDFKAGVGAAKDLDIWVQTDILTLGLGAKYSIINQELGFSMAVAGGIGWSSGTDYYYFAPVFSYKTEKNEPYFAPRFNFVDVDSDYADDFYDDIADNKVGPVILAPIDFPYVQLALGNRFWASERMYIGLEASVFIENQSAYDFKNNFAATAFIGGFMPSSNK